jgi:hypothetical protein
MSMNVDQHRFNAMSGLCGHAWVSNPMLLPPARGRNARPSRAQIGHRISGVRSAPQGLRTVATGQAQRRLWIAVADCTLTGQRHLR